MRRHLSIQSKFICDCTRTHHILKNPRKLPCGKTLCLECIEVLANSAKCMKCPFCDKIHRLSTDLSRNMMIENTLDEELDTNCKHVIDMLTSKTLKLKSLYAERRLIQHNIFDFIENDLEVRVESLKVALEKIKIQLNAQLEQAKIQLNKTMSNFEKEFVEETSKSKTFLSDYTHGQHARNKIKHFTPILATEKQVNCDKLTIEHVLGSLRGFEANLFDSNIFLDLDYKPTFFLTDFNACDLSEFTNGKFICINSNQNGLFVLNKNYKLVTQVKSIGETWFFQPRQIDYHNSSQIVLVCTSVDKDITCRKLILIDKHLKHILYTIENCNPANFYLTEKGDLLYFVDFSTKSLFCFNIRKKDMIRKSSTLGDKPSSLNIEKEVISVCFTDKLMGVNFKRERVCVYSIDTGLLQTTVNRPTDSISIHSLYLNHLGLYMHFNDFYSDELVLFERNANNLDFSFSSKYSLQLTQDGRFKGSHKLIRCGENFYLILWGKELVLL